MECLGKCKLRISGKAVFPIKSLVNSENSVLNKISEKVVDLYPNSLSVYSFKEHLTQKEFLNSYSITTILTPCYKMTSLCSIKEYKE